MPRGRPTVQWDKLIMMHPHALFQVMKMLIQQLERWIGGDTSFSCPTPTCHF